MFIKRDFCETQFSFLKRYQMITNKVSDVLAAQSTNERSQRAISWSKQGLIAYGLNTTRHQTSSSNLFFSHMECINGKNWQLADPAHFRLNTTLESSKVNFKSNKRQPTIKYLEFSNTGWDLFVADENGMISILVTGLKKVEQENNNQTQSMNPVEFTRTSFNSCIMFYSDYSIQPQFDISSPKLIDGNQVITMKWLNTDKVTISNAPATRNKQTSDNPLLNGSASKHGAANEDSNGFYFQYDVQQHKPYGVVHPLPSKQACLAVRKNGTVCLLYQEDHGIDYKKSTTQLETNSCEISKASIGFSKDGHVIIIAYFEKENHLRVYELDIDWKFLKTASKVIAEQPHYRVPDDQRIPPVITTKRLFIKSVDSKAHGMNFSDLILLSPTHVSDANFELLLKFDKIRNFSNDDVQTKYLRYTLEDMRISQVIPKSFKNMASKKGIDITSVSGSTYKLNYIQNFQFNEMILSTQLFSMDMFIAFIPANGSIQILDRSNFTILNNPYNKSSFNEDYTIPSKIQSFFDAGFEFPIISEQFNSCFISANMCSYVYLPTNSTNLKLACMTTENVANSFYDGTKKGLLFSTSVAVALCHTTACYQGYFMDDIIVTLRNEIERLSKKSNEGYSYRVAVAVIQECHRAINLNIDIQTDQSETMSRSQPLQRLLSLQLSLGSLENWQKNRSGKIAFALINLRFVVTTVVYVINTVYQNIQRFSKKGIPDIAENLILRERCILSSIGLIRWCLDYIVMLAQELFELQNAFKFNNVQQIDKCMKESLVIPMMMGKIPRGFLLTAISSIKRLFSFLQKLLEKTDPQLVVQSSPENPMGAFQKLEELFLNNDTSVLLKTVNAKFSKSYFTQPTFEAYLILGSMLKSMPISIVAFEKFLAETDIPLRANKLDSVASLALEQQIVCQGVVKSSFSESMKKVCDVFDKIVLQLPDTSISDLFFHDVSWIGVEPNLNSEHLLFDNMKDIEQADASDKKKIPYGIISSTSDIKEAKKQFSLLIHANIYDGLILDSLRKTLKSPEQYMSEIERMPNSSTSYDDYGIFKVKKCIRCGSISSLEDDVVAVTSNFSFINSPVFQHYQRQCICGGSWADV